MHNYTTKDIVPLAVAALVGGFIIYFGPLVSKRLRKYEDKLRQQKIVTPDEFKEFFHLAYFYQARIVFSVVLMVPILLIVTLPLALKFGIQNEVILSAPSAAYFGYLAYCYATFTSIKCPNCRENFFERRAFSLWWIEEKCQNCGLKLDKTA